MATGEAALEEEKLVFVEKERALQSMQHAFNELQQKVRTKEGDKNLAVQRLQYLKEKGAGLQEFLDKSGAQLKGIEESIGFTQLQLDEEEKAYEGLNEQLENLKIEADEKRGILDSRRNALEEIRMENQQVQRSQFEAEKKVAVADTSIQNLLRAIQQIEQETEQRASTFETLDAERQQKSRY
ncbi:hypothetical protein LWM68_37090 [Niabella sp. W65]|nr:hypothetical protein [Niabella sp. W65]MCH7367870.1 hypothetical protein [Niabella sp. W65]ULT43207.1 hypothetical protein KRR40_06885 [Niabella sp. I65]